MSRRDLGDGQWSFGGGYRARPEDALPPRYGWKLRLASALILVPSVALFGGGPAYARASIRHQRIVTRADAIAKRGHFDPKMILDPKGWRADRAAKAEAKRKAEVAAMRKRLGPDPKKLAALHAEVKAIRAAAPDPAPAALARGLDAVARMAARGKRPPASMVKALAMVAKEARQTAGRHSAVLRAHVDRAVRSIRGLRRLHGLSLKRAGRGSRRRRRG